MLYSWSFPSCQAFIPSFTEVFGHICYAYVMFSWEKDKFPVPFSIAKEGHKPTQELLFSKHHLCIA